MIDYSEKAVAMVEHGDILEIFKVVYSCKKKLGEKGSKLNSSLIELCKKFKDMSENVQSVVSLLKLICNNI